MSKIDQIRATREATAEYATKSACVRDVLSRNPGATVDDVHAALDAAKFAGISRENVAKLCAHARRALGTTARRTPRSTDGGNRPVATTVAAVTAEIVRIMQRLSRISVRVGDWAAQDDVRAAHEAMTHASEHLDVARERLIMTPAEYNPTPPRTPAAPAASRTMQVGSLVLMRDSVRRQYAGTELASPALQLRVATIGQKRVVVETLDGSIRTVLPRGHVMLAA